MFSQPASRGERRSIFREEGLLGEECISSNSNSSSDEDRQRLMSFITGSSNDSDFFSITGLALPSASSKLAPVEAIMNPTRMMPSEVAPRKKSKWLSRIEAVRISRKTNAANPTASTSRISTLAMLVGVVFPSLCHRNGCGGRQVGAAQAFTLTENVPHVNLEKRDDSPTSVCKRWAHQAASLNGTVYIYGGEAKTDVDQVNNTWNNDFLTLDLTKSWSTKSPALKGLPIPNGPPKVALGYLWNDYENLFLYGGEFADNPYVEPSAVSTWKYTISSGEWKEFKDPETSPGNFSSGSAPVQRAAEGAGVSVPELGRSWYFGGHLDQSTTPGWSNKIDRMYLKSLLEFTHPGYANNGVDSLRAAGAGDGGVYRNITKGGNQDSSGFSERADGSLVYIPGWGDDGLLLGLGGGTADDAETTDSFSSMETIDVYDIAHSTWYHQKTTGTAPSVRVNPCTIIFAAPDASSFNIYMYGGQNLIPYGNQTQYTDIWILTVPSFTWIKAGGDGDDQPAGRAGHTCHARDGQMVVVGGYIGSGKECDSPGIYAYDASSLKWKSSFDAGSHPAKLNANNIILANSFGYEVPTPVQSVVGGNARGGAKIKMPAAGVTAGPFKTGTPPVFIITERAATNEGGLIAAGLVAGVIGCLAIYLGYCALLYRRQVKAYKRHILAMNQPDPGATGPPTLTPERAHMMSAVSPSSPRDSESRPTSFVTGLRDKFRGHRRTLSSSLSPALHDNRSGEQFGWVGQGLSIYNADSHSPREEGGSETKAGVWGDGVGGVEAGAGGAKHHSRRKSSAAGSTSGSISSVEALLEGKEPSYWGTVLRPRRALRVVNVLEE